MWKKGVLMMDSLPPLYARQKPRHIIEYAKTTRQAVLKYLAILRWKSSVDIPSSSSSTQALTHPFPAAESFPTPHSNGESNSPGAFVGKGKGRAMDEPVPVVRGKVTDAKRITHFMEHQNRQHEDAVAHVRHAADMIESLRWVRIHSFRDDD
jgi:mediator of RNA polymerase II transcription subunit 14